METDTAELELANAQLKLVRATINRLANDRVQMIKDYTVLMQEHQQLKQLCQARADIITALTAEKRQGPIMPANFGGDEAGLHVTPSQKASLIMCLGILIFVVLLAIWKVLVNW